MYTNRCVKKGEVIKAFASDKVLPMFPFKTSLKHGSLFDIDICKNCGRAIWTTNNEDQILASSVSKLPRFHTDRIVSNKSCPNGMFCSSECKETFDDVMNFGVETRKFFYRLLGHSAKDRDIKDFALVFASYLYRKVLQGEVDPLPYKRFANRDLGDDDVDEQVRNCWVILRSEIILNTTDAVDDVEVISSLPFFHSIYKVVRESCIFQVVITNPIQKYIHSTILKLSDRELQEAIEILRKHLPSLASRTDHDADSISEDVLHWRVAARITQASSRDGQEDDQLSSILDTETKQCLKHMFQTYFVYCPNVNLHHSCVPNAMVETHENEKGCTNIALVALHDIDMGQILTVSKIDDIEGNVHERQLQLEGIFGKGYMCSCTRCRCERCLENRKVIVVSDDPLFDGHIRQDNTFYWLDLKHMADLAMQHGKYKTANKLYTIILNQKPNIGDVLHARCASILESGNFLKSQMLWKEAFQLCPSHEGISLQVRKQDVYNLDLEKIQKYEFDKSTNAHMTGHLPRFTTLIPSKCFMTMPDCPLISTDECQKAIEWAELEAKSRKDGWTTSRHYAVPTTDIPIHEIPPLLQWFNHLFCDRIRPLLAAQFGEHNVGKEGRNIFIHDAFIVRYDASGGQKHLPLHRDQSTHSFTIALNSTSDYDGGGTYVASLKRSICPSIGGMTSFRGDELLHGGDPVVTGRRYIIVGFCYASHLNNIVRPLGKKIKLDTQFHNKSSRTRKSLTQDTNNGFSFGFQLG